MSEADGALGDLVLSGVKIVDFSRLLPGPWCAQLLGDLGADVIKVEQTGVGDPSRHNPPNFRKSSVYFNSVNSNKRGIALNLAEPGGLEVAQRLIKWADVMIESYRPNVAARLSIDYESAKAINPGIIYASFSGYGQTGPMAGIPGHDLVIQAGSGHLGTNLDAQPLPAVPGFQAGDYAGAAMGAIGLLAAVMKKRQTGVGTRLDISLFDSLLYMCKVVHTGSLAALSGLPTTPRMEVYGANPRYATYLAGDGKAVAVSLLEARVWAHFCRHIGRDDLVSEVETPADRHSTHGDRAEVYRLAIAEFIAAKPRAELCAEMEAHDIPICPIMTPEEALQNEHVAARGLVKRVEHPEEGEITLLANPLARSGLTAESRTPAPSTLGRDNEAVLEMLGYSPEQRRRLRAVGVIGGDDQHPVAPVRP